MPIGSTSKSSTIFSQLGFFGGVDTSSPSQNILPILESRALAEKIIKKYDFKKNLYPDLWDEKNQKWLIADPKEIPTREGSIDNLLSLVSFTKSEKNPLIEIKVEMQEPKIAADLANYYTTELRSYLNENTLTKAKTNRIFIEKQMKQNKTNLIKIGKELSKFYSANKVSDIEAALDVLTEEDVSDIPAPDAATKNDSLKKNPATVEMPIDPTQAIGSVPQNIYLEYLVGKFKLIQQIQTQLIQQYEVAKMEEAKEDLVFQVIDPAYPPSVRFKPQRKRIVMATFFGSCILSVFYAFFRDYLEKLKAQGRPA